MSKNWTKGPWQRGFTVNHERAVCDDSIVVARITGFPITKNSNANAHLISAAPELYDALEAGEALISGDATGAEWKQGCHAFVKAARAALAKARGES